MTETTDQANVDEAQAASTTPTVAQLEAKIAELEAKSAANQDQALRARAEMENIRRRSQKDLENAHKFALERFVQELIPVVDSMELGMAAAAQEAQDVSKFREGSELTHKMFINALEKFSVKQLNPEGEKFKPDHHQAISAVERNDIEANTVVTVVQKGFLLNDRLVRPALVVVSKNSAA